MAWVSPVSLATLDRSVCLKSCQDLPYYHRSVSIIDGSSELRNASNGLVLCAFKPTNALRLDLSESPYTLRHKLLNQRCHSLLCAASRVYMP